MDLSEIRGLEEKRPIVVFSPHPLQPARDRVLEYARFLPGETIGAYLERTGILARMGRQPFVLTLDGVRVPASLWTRCRPKPGTLINLYAVVTGGGGRKNPLATIAMIALMVTVPGTQGFGAQLAGALGVTSSIGVGLVTIGLVAAGGLVINSLFPPPKPPVRELAGPRSESPTYAIGGGQNQLRRYQPFMKIIGGHRVVPDFGAIPYSEFEGEDQVGYYVFDYGYNDVELSDHKIGATLLTEFPGYTLEESGPDGKLTTFPANVDAIAGGVLERGEPVTRTGSLDATRLAVELAGSLFALTTEGEVVKWTVSYTIEYRAVGAADWIPLEYGETMGEGIAALNADDEAPGTGVVRISGRKRAPTRRTYTWLVPQGQYEVRVTRASTVFPEAAVAELQWTQLRSYQPDTADYTGRKRLALKIKASALATGTLEQFSSMARARCLTWNGTTWEVAHTSNPAWWYLDVIRGKTVGGMRVWGGGQADSRTDVENIKAFGAWCAAQGLNVDGVFDQQVSVYDMLSAIALCGRATPSWGTGKLGVVWDAPDLPVTAYFGMHNIVAGSFEIEYATEALADVVEVGYVDPERDWQRNYVRCKVPGATSEARVKRVEAPLCIKRQLAIEWGNLLAAANSYRNRRYKWRMDWEAFGSARGDVGALSHDLASLDYSGRFIEGGSSSSLKLPSKVPLYSPVGFVVIVRPDGTASVHRVAGGVGETDTLQPVSEQGQIAALPFDPWGDPDHPPYDYRWHYGPTETPGRKVKIESLKPVSERYVDVAAVDERPEYYASKSNPTAPAPAQSTFGQVTLSDLRLDEDGVRAGKGYLAKVTASWEASGDYAAADVLLSVNGGPLEPIAQNLRARGVEFTVQDDSDVTVEVTAWSSLGRLGRVVTLSTAKHIHFAALSPPSNVATFGLNGRAFEVPQAPEVDVTGAKIRFHLGNRRTWEDALPLHEGEIPEFPWEPAVMPTGQVSFGVKYVDAARQESPDAVWIVTDLGDAPVANVIEEIDLKALGFPGTITDATIVSGDLKADEVDKFYKPDDGAPFYAPSDGDAFYFGTEYAQLVYVTGDVVPAAPLAGSTLTIAAAMQGTPAFIEYRKDGDGPMYSEDDSDPFYSPDDADPFYDAKPDWKPWTGALTVQHQAYNFRVTIGQGALQGVISELVLTIDAPDLENVLDDVVISAGGTRLPITHDFTAIKNVTATLQADGGTATGVRIMDKDPDLGPLVRCVDKDENYVSGTIDARVKGY